MLARSVLVRAPRPGDKLNLRPLQTRRRRRRRPPQPPRLELTRASASLWPTNLKAIKKILLVHCFLSFPPFVCLLPPLHSSRSNQVREPASTMFDGATSSLSAPARARIRLVLCLSACPSVSLFVCPPPLRLRLHNARAQNNFHTTIYPCFRQCPVDAAARVAACLSGSRAPHPTRQPAKVSGMPAPLCLGGLVCLHWACLTKCLSWWRSALPVRPSVSFPFFACTCRRRCCCCCCCFARRLFVSCFFRLATSGNSGEGSGVAPLCI